MCPAPVVAAGEDEDHVLAHAGDLGLDLRFGAVADADGGDDGGDADDHAEHGQQGAQHVAAQGAQGDFEGGQNSFHTCQFDRLLRIAQAGQFGLRIQAARPPARR